MGQRSMVGLGIASLVVAAVGVLAPQAAARELAPGLDCERITCRNDTDDRYRLEIEVTCWNGPRTEIRYITAHSTRYLDDLSCPPMARPGTTEQDPPTTRPDGTWEHPMPRQVPGELIPQVPQRIEYRGAVVENVLQPQQQSGSAAR
ncbi:hypothetical protein NDR87_33925 [Nocardia sp. CDC159]|uniref:Secreted protein n=1 Tax=Nocardia pulmonis TaxID=2951408 RepID=A0A9X2J2X3_9NOCA|nr:MULTISPECIES: hypothetical protein [Nocardia]MCM6778496.1 hypothetical protein [Nocardia pulmonis]MCM6791385.1 hypothetical protein [Nocardia sp. CDC159]